MLGHILKPMTISHFRMYKNILNLASEMGRQLICNLSQKWVHDGTWLKREVYPELNVLGAQHWKKWED